VADDGSSGFNGDGGDATSARLGDPYDVAVDASGNIYIADSGNDRIRMVTKSTGIITTVAGDGSPG
jgi:NHL repeat